MLFCEIGNIFSKKADENVGFEEKHKKPQFYLFLSIRNEAQNEAI